MEGVSNEGRKKGGKDMLGRGGGGRK